MQQIETIPNMSQVRHDVVDRQGLVAPQAAPPCRRLRSVHRPVQNRQQQSNQGEHLRRKLAHDRTELVRTTKQLRQRHLWTRPSICCTRIHGRSTKSNNGSDGSFTTACLQSVPTAVMQFESGELAVGVLVQDKDELFSQPRGFLPGREVAVAL